MIIEIPKDIIYGLDDYTGQENRALAQAREIPNFNKQINVTAGRKMVTVDLRYSKPNNILYPGDIKEVDFNFWYYVNGQIETNMLKYNIIYALYADNMLPKKESLPLSELNCY